MQIELGDGAIKNIPKKTITLTVALSKKCFFQVPFFVMPSGSNPVILGAPFFHKFSPYMNYEDRKTPLLLVDASTNGHPQDNLRSCSLSA